MEHWTFIYPDIIYKLQLQCQTFDSQSSSPAHVYQRWNTWMDWCTSITSPCKRRVIKYSTHTPPPFSQNFLASHLMVLTIVFSSFCLGLSLLPSASGAFVSLFVRCLWSGAILNQQLAELLVVKYNYMTKDIIKCIE